MIEETEYKFEVITDVDVIKQHIDQDYERILELLSVCFNLVDYDKGMLQFLEDSTVFLCKVINTDKIIGIATNIMNNYYVETDDKITTYDPTIYFTNKEYDSDGKIKIFHGLHGCADLSQKLEYEFVTLDPCIYSLCKDKAYKNVGSFLLKNICDYYKNKDYTKIYIVPESSRHRNQLMNTNVKTNNAEFTSILKKYKHDQTMLFDYYKKNGFVTDSNNLNNSINKNDSINENNPKKIYSIEKIDMKGLDNCIMFYEVMTKYL
jgi:hypothetical protein